MPKLGLSLKKTVYSCSKHAFVQILMSKIKLNVTMNIGQLTLIRIYTYSKRKTTKCLYQVPLGLSNPVLSHAADPTIIKIQGIP